MQKRQSSRSRPHCARPPGELGQVAGVEGPWPCRGCRRLRRLGRAPLLGLNPTAPTACPHPLGQAFGLPTCPQARLRRSNDLLEQSSRTINLCVTEQPHRLLDLAAHPCCTCSISRRRQTVARLAPRDDIRGHHRTRAVLSVFFAWHDVSLLGPLLSRSLHPFVNRRSRARVSKLAPGDRSGIWPARSAPARARAIDLAC